MRGDKTTFIGAKASPELAAKLAMLAKATRRTKSDVLRILIENAAPRDLVVVEGES